jgi:hypothetical protein
MGLRETLYSTDQILTDAGVEHALIGGLALAMFGIHRATFDVDFLVNGGQKDSAAAALKQAGWLLQLETKEVLHFTGKGQVDLLLANRPLSLEMLATAQVGTGGLKCVSPEGLIGLKIQAYKNDREREFQDKADIKSLIRNYPSMQWAKVKEFADLFSEWAFVDSLREKQ